MIDKDVALVIIDVQKDYFNGGNYPLHKAEKALTNTRLVLESFRASKRPIFHIQHISLKEEATFFKRNTRGVEIHLDLEPLEDEYHIIKHYPNAFLETELKQKIDEHNIKTLIICGMMSHHCIDTSVRVAKELGYQVYLLHDACASRSLSFKGEILEAHLVHDVFMASLQAFATVLSTKKLLSQIE